MKIPKSSASMQLTLLRRLMAGHEILVLVIEVRVLAEQPYANHTAFERDGDSGIINTLKECR